MLTEDTIVAPATPAGYGGIGIIRLSGKQALSIIKQCISIQTITPRKAHFCSFYDNNDLLDKGILLYFKAPFSFTGEDVIECQLHGSPVVLTAFIHRLCSLGARMANPGEFSMRAFLNGKMDLAEAEAVSDLIHAKSLKAAKLATQTLSGKLSKWIHQLNNQLIHLRTYIEAMIDFPDEDIDEKSIRWVKQQYLSLKLAIESYLPTLKQGQLLREGVTIVIAGAPNVGKSTLINLLSGEPISIVTDVPGTTRDVMKTHILLDDMPIHIIDTAGLRESDDIVEKEGIKRTKEVLSIAQMVLCVIDPTRSETIFIAKDMLDGLPKDLPILMIYNKMDLFDGSIPKDAISLCAKTGQGIDVLKQAIKNQVGSQDEEGLFLARERHIKAIHSALAIINEGLDKLTIGDWVCIAMDLKMAHEALSSITGEFSTEDLLGTIFSTFCIGK